MEIGLTQLCDLNPDFDDPKILVRCISVWKSHAFGNPDQVFSFNGILQDQQGNRIQMTVKGKQINKFQLLMKEGACYKISNFGVAHNSGLYPLLKHDYKVVLYQGTTVTRVPSFDQNPRGFKFEHFNALTSRILAENELIDVIGTVVSVTDAIPFNLYNKDQIRRTVILEDVTGVQLECCFFDAWCNNLSKLHDERESMGHVVMILQSCKVKYFNHKPIAQPAMYSTKLYLNDDIPEIAVFRQRYAERDGFDPSTHTIALLTPVKKEVTADDFFNGAIKKTVGTIRDSDGPYHCIIYAKIHKINRENGWTYLACKKCGRIAKKADSVNNKQLWNCRTHLGLTASQVHMRFKVVVRVMDDTGTASLLLFDDLVFNLNGRVHCHRLLQEHGPNYEDYFPTELNVLVGKKVLWRFHYTQDHIEKNSHQYQVKLMTQDESMIARFKQNFIFEENNSELHTPIVDAGKTSRFSHVDNVPFNIEKSPNTVVDFAGKGNETHSSGEGSSKSNEKDGGDTGSGKRTLIDLDDWDEEAAIAKRNKQPIHIKMEPKD